MTITEMMRELGVPVTDLTSVICFVKKLPITNWQAKVMLDQYATENQLQIKSPLNLISETECQPS